MFPGVSILQFFIFHHVFLPVEPLQTNRYLFTTMLAEPLSRKQYKSLGPYTTKTLHKNKQDLSYISIGDPYDRSKKDKNSRWSKSIFYFQLICTNFMLPIFNFLLVFKIFHTTKDCQFRLSIQFSLTFDNKSLRLYPIRSINPLFPACQLTTIFLF